VFSYTGTYFFVIRVDLLLISLAICMIWRVVIEGYTFHSRDVSCSTMTDGISQ